MSQQWPIDFESLTKDYLIEVSTIESAYAVDSTKDPQAYAFALLQLLQEIRVARPDLSGHVRERKGCIRVMTDAEADDWQDKRYHDTIKSVYRIGKRRGSIDRSGFDAKRISKCESVDVSIGATLITARSEQRRHHRLLAAISRLPKLSDGK